MEVQANREVNIHLLHSLEMPETLASWQVFCQRSMSLSAMRMQVLMFEYVKQLVVILEMFPLSLHHALFPFCNCAWTSLCPAITSSLILYKVQHDVP